MLEGILFNNDKYFDSTDDNNLIDTMTKNTIILCEDSGVKMFLSNAIKEICRGVHKESGYDYYYVNEDIEYKIGLDYLPTTELFIDNEQKIVITIEAPYVLTAKDPEDIWLAARTADNKISIYPIRVFKGYKEKWAEGIDSVYRFIVQGRYGCYVMYNNVVEDKIGEVV